MTHKQFNEKSLSEDSQTIFNFLYNYDKLKILLWETACHPPPCQETSASAARAAGSNRKQLEWQILPLLFEILGLFHLTDAASKGKRLCYHISPKRGFLGVVGNGCVALLCQLYMWNYVN